MKQTILPLLVGVVPFFTSLLFLLPVAKNAVVSAKTINSNPTSRNINIMNESGRRVDVHWVSLDGEFVIQSKPFVHNGASLPLSSYVGHTFRVKEIARTSTGACGDEKDEVVECREGYFTVSENEDQIIYVKRGIIVEHVDNIEVARRTASDLVASCEDRALGDVSDENDDGRAGIHDAIKNMVSCIGSSVTGKITESNEEISFQAKIREDMSVLLNNYTCGDEILPMTEAVRTQHFKYRGASHQVDVMHDRDSSNIHLIKNFISDKECDAIAKVSGNAMQASITVPWHLEKRDNPITRLSRRVFEYTNKYTGYDLQEFGQEDLVSIQYKEGAEPDRYVPHCDGECTGVPFRDGTRVATMVMYCTVPGRGGATNFMNAGVHILPKRGDAIFFSYMSPETKIMDKGFTRHSGCPVIEGEKRIVAQWMRMGVSKGKPWDSYDSTLGVKYTQADDYSI